MRELPGRAWRVVARWLALTWLLVIAPLELASTLAGLLAGPTTTAPAAIGLIAMRVLVTAAGMMLGRSLLQRIEGLRPLALAWAAADLGTLALVLASARLPSNRMPGDEPLVWSSYAVAAAIVVAASPPARRD